MNTSFKKIALAATLVSGLAIGLPAFAQNGTPDDAAIAQQVKAALSQAYELQDSDDDVSVAVNNGVVKLSGWVSYAADVKTAEKIAETVPGVKDVDSNFRVWSTSSRNGL